MNKWILWMALIASLCILTSCTTIDIKDKPTTALPDATESAESNTDPTVDDKTAADTDETTVEIEKNASDIEEVTEPAPQIVELTETYTVKIQRGDFPIHSGPGAEYPVVAKVEQAGVYTIVAELQHTDGTLWGRL